MLNIKPHQLSQVIAELVKA